MEVSTHLRRAADVDLDQFVTAPDTQRAAQTSPSQVEPADAEMMASVGVHVEGEDRSGTFILRDFHPLCVVAHSDDFELLALADALRKYGWLRERYYWKAVPTDLDEITAQCASQPEPQGYFVRVKKGAKVRFPVQACLYITRGDIAQMVHNVVILEEDSELHLITGCATRTGVSSAVHLGISEHYVGRNARLTSTMIHSWGTEVKVRPRSGTIVEEGGMFISNYVALRPGGHIQSNPRTWLNGRTASAKYFTIILGSEGSNIITGGEVYLNAEDTSAEIAHRGVCTGGQLSQEGLLIGKASCRAHVDCAGLLLDPGDEGFIQSIPGLKALHPEAQMSHEASIGKIAPEQVAYLQTRGIEEREAISMIIRGFLDADIEGLGPELDARIAEIAELAGHGEK